MPHTQQYHSLLAVLAHAPMGVALLREPDHQLDYWNDLFDEFFPGARKGVTVKEALPDLATQAVVAQLDQLFQSGESYQSPVMPLPGSGGSRYVTLTYQAYWEQGRMAGVALFIQEVTAQELARQRVEETSQRLARQQQFLQQVLTQAPVAVAIFRGPRYVIELANPAVCALWGRTQQQALGTPLFELLPEAAGQGFEQLLDDVMTTGVPYVARELPSLIDRHGRRDTVYWNFVYQPLTEEQGQTTGVMVVATEVSELVDARLASEATVRGLRLLTDALPVLIGYLDRERRYQFTNEAYRAWFHIDPASLVGRYVREVVGEAAYAATAGYMDRALAGERVIFDATMPYRPGFTRHIHTNYVPDVRNGEVVGFYTLVTDITEQVEAQQQVEGLNEELRARNSAMQLTNRQLTRTNADLDTFVYTASHDLRSPIANIEGLLSALRQELLENPPPSVEVEHILMLMEQSINRFQVTIGHLTDVMQVQQGGHRTPTETVDVAALINDVLLDLAALREQMQATVQVDVSRCPLLRFSPKDLRSIVVNLLSNAIKYRAADRRPVVELTMRCDEPWVELRVQDNGLGLSAEQQSKLFRLFGRLHTHVEGTGVGLYSIKKLVDNAGGTIAVTSELGVGTAFTVLLPLSPAP